MRLDLLKKEKKSHNNNKNVKYVHLSGAEAQIVVGRESSLMM